MNLAQYIAVVKARLERFEEHAEEENLPDMEVHEWEEEFIDFLDEDEDDNS